MEDLEWDDFCLIADGVSLLNERDADEIAKLRGNKPPHKK